MRSISNAVLLAILLAWGGTAATAATITIFGTGQDANGAVVADGTVGDAHYTLTTPDTNNPMGPDLVLPILAGSTAPNTPTSLPGGWLADGADPMSRWIGVDTTAKDFITSFNTNYTFTTTFDLTGLDPTTAQLSGQIAADNNVSILLNGVNVGFSGAGFQGFTPFSIVSDPLADFAFESGVNTLSFVVRNATAGGELVDNPMGLRVEIAGTATAIPLPASVLLLLSGLGALAVLRRRRGQPA